MQSLFNIINKPLAYVLEWLASLFGGSFPAAVFFFTLIINIALIPLSIKSQKSSVQQTRIKPKLDELKKRYGDNKQKYSEAMQQLYTDEGVSMSGGCLPMILRLIIMMSIYWLLMQPITYLMHVDSATIAEAAKALGVATNKSGYELDLIKSVLANADKFPELAEKFSSINFNFIGLSLTDKPTFSFDIFNDFQKIWLMPIIAFAAQIFTSLISMLMQKKTNPEAPSMMGMMLTMPLFSLFIGFTLPGGVTFYWACSSLIGGFVQLATQYFYGPHKMLAKERTKELAKQCDFEAGQIKKFNSVTVNGEEENS
ncbi:MAG: YidC/Oxa1 family membrane protein insertase [Clostridia bacterium]|nr:YidC/Oxa1 family membrane protein insertase [Clostridia bacterium]